jgi:hypothetical protein
MGWDESADNSKNLRSRIVGRSVPAPPPFALTLHSLEIDFVSRKDNAREYRDNFILVGLCKPAAVVLDEPFQPLSHCIAKYALMRVPASPSAWHRRKIVKSSVFTRPPRRCVSKGSKPLYQIVNRLAQ